MSYIQARSDFEYLDSLINLDDVLFVSDEAFNLLENPTKKYASEVYKSMIDTWFHDRRNDLNKDSFNLRFNEEKAMPYVFNTKMRKIADRYTICLEWAGEEPKK